MDIFRAHVLVCSGQNCLAPDSADILTVFKDQITAKGIDKEVKVLKTDCAGACEDGPVVVIYPEGVTYYRVSSSDVSEIINEHLINGRFVTRLMARRSEIEAELPVSIEDTNFFRKQKRIALRNCGIIDPEKIEEYIAYDGYQALAKALRSMTPAEVLNEVKKIGRASCRERV